MNALTPQEIIEINLKTEISRQVGLKNFEFNSKCHTFQHLFKTWKVLYTCISAVALTEMVWDYFLTSREKLYIKLKSSVFGEYSRIADYENSKGKKHKAHFKANGKYIGPVSKLGDKPIAYDTALPVSKEKFVLKIEKILTAKSPEELFEFKSDEIDWGSDEEDEDDEVPIAQLIQQRKAKK